MKSAFTTSMLPAGVATVTPAPDHAPTEQEPPNQQDALAPEFAELVDQTLNTGFTALRFPAALEARFQQDTAHARLQTLTIAGTVAAVVLNLFLLADYAMVHDVFDQALVLRTWLFTPLCLLGMWLIGKLPNVLTRELMAVGACLLACVIEVYLCSASTSPYAAPYTTGLAMIIMYVNVFVRPRFWMAVPTTGAMLLLFVLSLATVSGHSPALSIPIGLTLLATAKFTLYYLYALEHQERHNYLLALRQRLLRQELTTANEELEKVSRCDALTGLANRRHFDEFMARLWARAENENTEISVLMLDVDHFKAYNDSYGHPAGDACLIQVADSLKRSLRRPGDLLARYGGEEFVAVFNRTPLSQAVAVAERVRAAVEGLAVAHAGSPCGDTLTLSIGVASMRPQDRSASPARLLALADEALYQAKNHGRNRIWPSGSTA